MKRITSAILAAVMLLTIALIAPVTASAEESYTVISGGYSMATATEFSRNKLYAAKLTGTETLYFKFNTPAQKGFFDFYAMNASIATPYSNDWHYEFEEVLINGLEEVKSRLYVGEGKENTDNVILQPNSTYYIRVHNTKATASGYFKFKLTFTEDKVNDTLSTATLINTDKKIVGTLDGWEDVDYYKFKTGSGKKYQLNMQNVDISTHSWSHDAQFYVQIRSSIEEIIQDLRATSGNTKETDVFELQPNTYYYVRVGNPQNGCGTYHFTVTDISAPKSIKLNKTSLTLIKDKTATLVAEVGPSTATKTVKWASSAPKVVAVSGGKLTAKAVGTATITATTTNGLKATCKVTVNLATPKITKKENKNGYIRLTWGKIAGAAKYRVYVKSGSKWVKAGDTTGTTFNYKKVKSGTTYTFTVRCMDKNSKAISAYNTTGFSYKYIAMPKVSKLTNTKTGVKVQWAKITGAAKYRVYVKSGSKWTKAGDTTGTSFVYKAAKNGKSYTFTVRCISKDGKSLTSAYDTKGKSIKYKK